MGPEEGDPLRASNIGATVHFMPLHRRPLYRDKYGYLPERFPVAEEVYKGLLSLPLYPKMTDQNVGDVIAAVREIIAAHPAPAALLQKKGDVNPAIPTC